jgi:hypothetical protein
MSWITQGENSYWLPDVLPDLHVEYQELQKEKVYLLPDNSKRVHPRWIYENGAYVEDDYLFYNEGWKLITNFFDRPISDYEFHYIENDIEDWEESEDGKSVTITWKKYTVTEPDLGDEDYIILKEMLLSEDWIFDDTNMTVERQYKVTRYTEEELNNKKWTSLRDKRNDLLQKTDWIVIYSLENNVNISQGVTNYRQQLRDLPETITDISIYKLTDIIAGDEIYPQEPVQPFFE